VDLAGNPRTAQQTFSLVLNRAPTLAPIGDRTAPLGSTLSFTVVGSDPDGDPTSLGVTPVPLPANATFDRTTGLFTFKPSLSQIGSISLTFGISDGALSDSETIAINVPPPGGVSTLQGRVLDANAYLSGQTVPVVNATILLLGTNRT